ncbi:MAG: hypothetical protein IJE08_11130 [Clostridia bacterium]|nr:hypothetical protein [Clostridia bacterium]
MDEMKSLGLDGVVFHPRFYPGKPQYLSQEYMDIVSDVILHAKATGMEFWLYDEDGWPSGAAGGQVMAKHPEFRIRMLHDDLTVTEIPGISSIEVGPVEAFIELTHERYAKMLKPEAFEYVTGFFTDEVGFGGHGSASTTGHVPWCADMPERFKTKALFENETGCEKIRIEYWEHLIDLLQERFYEPIRRWCDVHGKKYTGHLKAEENPYFQVCYSGSAISSLKGFSLPGIDALERYIPHSFFTRLPASVSLQFGDGHAMCEAMGGSGWGTNPQDEEKYLLDLAKQGVDTFVMHIQQFKLDEKSLKDWPPSRPCDLTWRDAYAEMLKRVRRKAENIDPMKPADALVVIPARGAMAGFRPADALTMNDHNGEELPDIPVTRDSLALQAMTDVLNDAGWCYDLTDEATFEAEAAQTNEGVKIGNRTYSQVLIAHGAVVNTATKATPEQSDWRLTGYEGEIKVPSSCCKKDEKHFLCTFDEPKEQLSAVDSGNLISSGYGFCRSVMLEKTVVVEEKTAGQVLMLTGVEAAAAEICLDGVSLGYTYGPDWTIELPDLDAGNHRIGVKLFNNGFNVYGPHHYYLGDFKLVSPLHIKGTKHFGDLPDAPECTHIPEWHFVNYRLFGNVHILNRKIREA